MKVYTKKELCGVLQVCERSLRRLLLSKQLKGFRIGQDWRVTEDSLNKYIKQQEAKQV